MGDWGSIYTAVSFKAKPRPPLQWIRQLTINAKKANNRRSGSDPEISAQAEYVSQAALWGPQKLHKTLLNL